MGEVKRKRGRVADEFVEFENKECAELQVGAISALIR